MIMRLGADEVPRRAGAGYTCADYDGGSMFRQVASGAVGEEEFGGLGVPEGPRWVWMGERSW